MGISENIKRRRMELNISQQELANALGYKSRSTIAKIEAGDNNVPETKIVRFARALDTTIEYIKTGVIHETIPKPLVPVTSRSLHKNVAIILAGGKSTRNMQNIPNQFINVLGKPVIIFCLEAYQRHPAIDDIYVVCLKGWENILSAYANQYHIEKLKGIIPAGETGVLSIKNCIEDIKTHYGKNDVVILQESTRPLITEEMISKLLNVCQKKGGAVTCEPMGDYLQFELNNDSIETSRQGKYLDRNRIVALESPEAYRLEIILDAFCLADSKNHKYSETCFAMLLYNLGYELCFYEGNHNNIKVVRQEDIAILVLY